MVMPISGSGSTKTAQRVDPFPTFKFSLEIGNIIEAFFTECTGLEMTADVFEYQEGGLNEYSHKLPGRTKVSNITMKRGFTTSNELFKWYKQMETAMVGGNPFDFRQVTITLYSTSDPKKKVRWTLDKAFPVKWAGPSFKTDEAAAAIETLELAHHGVKVESEK